MAQAFKNKLGEGPIRLMAQHLSRVQPAFNITDFLALALKDLHGLSLMQRNDQIVRALKASLPDDYIVSKNILLAALSPVDNQVDELGLHSWLVVPVAEYLGRFAEHHLSDALSALAQVTPYFSSEWAIRHLLAQQQTQTLQVLHEWCQHPDEHVRRLVSEGSRPRLPWGFQLKAFIKDPELTFPLLEKLKDDESDYVRLSVANHLNDMSKDHGDWLQQKLKSWIDTNNVKRIKLIRHALRTLIKQGHGPTLSMLGYEAFAVENIQLTLEHSSIEYGQSLQFNVVFNGPPGQPLMLDYAVYFKKADGSLSAKVFKWKNTHLNASGEIRAKKSHAIKPITTRRYYDGVHKLELLANGQSIAMAEFELRGVESV